MHYTTVPKDLRVATVVLLHYTSNVIIELVEVEAIEEVDSHPMLLAAAPALAGITIIIATELIVLPCAAASATVTISATATATSTTATTTASATATAASATTTTSATATAYIILCKLLLGLVQLHVDVMEIMHYAPVPLVLLVEEQASSQDPGDILQGNPESLPVDLRLEPANPICLNRSCHTQPLESHHPAVPCTPSYVLI